MARQKLGQHFLIQSSVLDRIAAAVCPAREDLVIEIGPGRGALTERLLERAARVIAVEIDSALVDHLRRRFAGRANLEIVHADVLATDLGQWGRAALAGNLPYYITSPILEKTAALGDSISRAVFLVQKEVAERLVAQPGERAYGYLTVAMALWAKTSMLFTVRPGAFRPPPEVDSAVVMMAPRAAGIAAADHDAFLRFVGLCFRMKRKTLRNNLAGTYGKELVDSWPEAGRRAEQISLDGFLAMYRRIIAAPEASISPSP
ncbi:MAG TPA: 16S rRNA (adenine(1518)-N(6)/adenine(1519)-N(6))-dimethyltransferase RsmA [Bryobacteraceae bacterium]|nr:16S rRNA (adenine(1518)-N(6)/adenine(1519)-N(6))-dimethyltransferase RsmA [Bryobacteraceae bacterium]